MKILWRISQLFHSGPSVTRLASLTRWPQSIQHYRTASPSAKRERSLHFPRPKHLFPQFSTLPTFSPGGESRKTALRQRERGEERRVGHNFLPGKCLSLLTQRGAVTSNGAQTLLRVSSISLDVFACGHVRVLLRDLAPLRPRPSAGDPYANYRPLVVWAGQITPLSASTSRSHASRGAQGRIETSILS